MAGRQETTRLDGWQEETCTRRSNIHSRSSIPFVRSWHYYYQHQMKKSNIGRENGINGKYIYVYDYEQQHQRAEQLQHNVLPFSVVSCSSSRPSNKIRPKYSLLLGYENTTRLVESSSPPTIRVPCHSAAAALSSSSSSTSAIRQQQQQQCPLCALVFLLQPHIAAASATV